MNVQEAKRRCLIKLKLAKTEDNQANHRNADQAILDFLTDIRFTDVVGAWEESNNHCNGFWYV